MNCKLTKNIALTTNAVGGCNGQDLSMAGGIKTPVYVYNIDDIENLKFENDGRADDSLTVETIITDAEFYAIEFTNATYNEEFEEGKWTHTLTLNIANITNLFQSSLFDAVGGRYLVAFRPSGDMDYRMFGWKYGASLDYSMNIAEDSQGYTVTLTDTSEYPLMSVWRDNFNTKDKVYTPIFKVFSDVSFCEEEGGVNNGYSIAMYAVKVNSAGQALDADNKLCLWSGKKQDAYRYSGASVADYHIIGTYGPSASFDGVPVRTYDPEVCPSTARGTITINGSSAATMYLNSTTVSSSVTITCTDSWTLLTAPRYVTVSPSGGDYGTSTVNIHHNGTGGVDILVFQNRITREKVNLTVNVNLIKVSTYQTFQNGTTTVAITPVVEGEGQRILATVSPETTINIDGVNVYVTIPRSNAQQEYALTLTHHYDRNEVKIVHITVLGTSDGPVWQMLSSFCEIS